MEFGFDGPGAVATLVWGITSVYPSRIHEASCAPLHIHKARYIHTIRVRWPCSRAVKHGIVRKRRFDSVASIFQCVVEATQDLEQNG